METVSVIIPTYDRDELVVRAVESVLAQTYPRLEVIVVDDCSPTPVRQVLSNARTDLDMVSVYRHGENRGGNAARKTGIDAASGDYLAFLDDDDEWVETKIERQVQRSKETGAGVVYTGVAQLNGEEVVGTKTPSVTGDVTIDLLGGNFIGTFSTVLIRRNLVDEVGYPDENLPSWHDWDYYLRLSEETAFGAVPEALVRRHSEGQEQISHNHATKRDVTVPRFLKKHRPLADKYGMGSEFEATVAAELGWSAVVNGEFSEARRHYLHSLKKRPSKKVMLFLVLTLGGRWTFRPTQKIKRALVGAASG